MASRILRQRGCRMVRLRVLLRSGQSQGDMGGHTGTVDQECLSAALGQHAMAHMSLR
jgi:hypothetical protein